MDRAVRQPQAGVGQQSEHVAWFGEQHFVGELVGLIRLCPRAGLHGTYAQQTLERFVRPRAPVRNKEAGPADGLTAAYSVPASA